MCGLKSTCQCLEAYGPYFLRCGKVLNHLFRAIKCSILHACQGPSYILLGWGNTLDVADSPCITKVRWIWFITSRWITANSMPLMHGVVFRDNETWWIFKIVLILHDFKLFYYFSWLFFSSFKLLLLLLELAASSCYALLAQRTSQWLHETIYA